MCVSVCLCVCVSVSDHSRARANCATATKIGMPDFIANTTVEFEIQLRRVTRSAVFTCFYLFCPVFALFFHSKARANCATATKTGMPHFIAHTTVEFEIQLRRAGIDRLVVIGFFTNFCIETTVRMSGNMGFDTYLVHDCCATTNRIGIDGTDYDPEIVHNLSVANMHGEFCTAISTQDALRLLDQDLDHMDRAQGNE